ncbi:hypothetical protein H6784_00980 [Candidatus Nomurabacteria bacterium]|nr:hypothetical protein [Candidatus Nomurabacteria bacterium]
MKVLSIQEEKRNLVRSTLVSTLYFFASMGMIFISIIVETQVSSAVYGACAAAFAFTGLLTLFQAIMVRLGMILERLPDMVDQQSVSCEKTGDLM